MSRGAVLDEARIIMKVHQLIGLLMWRGGLLLAAGSALFLGVRFILHFIRVPLPVEIGLALLGSGALLVLGSMIAERIKDSRSEGDEP